MKQEKEESSFLTIEKVVFPDEETLRKAEKDAMDGSVGTLRELAQKYGGEIVYGEKAF